VTAYVVLAAAIGTLRWIREHLCDDCRAKLDRHLDDLEAR
jgi:hypothetical protein